MTLQNPHDKVTVKCPYCRADASVDSEAIRRGFPCKRCGRIVNLLDTSETKSVVNENTNEPLQFVPANSPVRVISYIAIAVVALIIVVFGMSKLGNSGASGGQQQQSNVPVQAHGQLLPQDQNQNTGNNQPNTQSGNQSIASPDGIESDPDAPVVKTLLDFLNEAESREEDESFLSLQLNSSGAGNIAEFIPESEVDLIAGATVVLPSEKTVMVDVLKISMSEEWVVLDVQESSVDFAGEWPLWREVIGASYLSTETGILMLPAIESCEGWTDGAARAGSSRSGTIAFPNNLSAPVNKMTLFFAYKPGLQDEGRVAIDFSIDPSKVITNPKFAEGGGDSSEDSGGEVSGIIQAGFEMLNQNDYQGAIDQFTRAIDIDPAQFDAWNGRGVARNMLGDNQEAITDFNQALQINSGSITTEINRAKVYIELEDYTNAMADLDHAISVDPYIAEAYYYRAWIYSAQGDDTKAVIELTQAIENDQENSTYYFARGLAYERLGQSDASAADVQKAEELGRTAQ
jgi:tetratricopeptide (TPR) repeat protein